MPLEKTKKKDRHTIPHQKGCDPEPSPGPNLKFSNTSASKAKAIKEGSPTEKHWGKDRKIESK